MNDVSRSTKKVMVKANGASWGDSFFFDGDDASVLVMELYQKRRIRKDKLVGSLKDTIGAILERVRGRVLDEPLGNAISGHLDPSGIAIKFSLTAEPHGGTSNDERHADDVSRTNEMTTPQIIGTSSGAVDPSTDALTEVLAMGKTWGELLQRIECFNEIAVGIPEIHPYASLASSVLAATNKVLANQQGHDSKVTTLARVMNDVFALVHVGDCLKTIEKHRKFTTLLIQQVTECSYFVAEYAKRKNFWIRTAKYAISDIDARFTEYENKFEELRIAFAEGIVLDADVTVFRMMNEVPIIGVFHVLTLWRDPHRSRIAVESIMFDDIPYASGARYLREKGCLPGTRECIIREIFDVLSDASEGAPQVCLLIGVAGSGKSSIAHTIARLYDGQKRLGSSFCFARTDVVMRNPQNLFSTIALDLSDHDPQLQVRALEEQLDRLIVQPSQNLHGVGPLFVVIDALDESGGPSERQQLLQLGDVDVNVVDRDITKFIQSSLGKYARLESRWPNAEWCQLLVHRSEQLFQWASTACKFIAGDGSVGLDPCEQLEVLLQPRRRDAIPLDWLYQTILQQLFKSDRARLRFREVMAILFALNEPLSLVTLAALFDRQMDMNLIIEPMGSLLDGAINQHKPIRPLHTSFRDYLLDEERSSMFYVPILPLHHLFLGHSLLACMRSMLKFNMCDLEDSRVRNAAIPGLINRVTAAIPSHMVYSCQYWMNHLQHAECTPELLHEVTVFFKNFFPYWVEAISLLSLSSPLIHILAALETCTILQKWTKGSEIAILASEAFQFIQVFAPVIRESTPHLYLSAMPQTPSSSPLTILWLVHMQDHLKVTLGHPSNWPAEVHILQGHELWATSI
ncbi:hypothetical protein J3R82DRAFT_10981 [Butyriboletus roseoflavus]|nr:hypothetical protein J3R82DRAFT_10981 [Butyriboletus roseoflavus]